MDVKLTVDLLNVNCFDITLHLQLESNKGNINNRLHVL